MQDKNEHVLTGIKVLDFTRALAGPSCTRMFAEMGAEVIKIESAPDGDMVRHMSKLTSERSLYFVQQNLNKKSFCLDLRKPQAKALLNDLVPQMDVVVENFKPGVFAKMGFSFEALKKLKQDVILCSISAMGQSGPLAAKPGYDYIAQAYSGVTSMIGEADEPPYIPLVGLGDVSTGVHAALAITSALLCRERTGKGQHLDISLLDVYYHFHEVNVHTYSATKGEVDPIRQGRHVSYICPAGVFTGNGGYLTLMGFLHHWPDLCAAMDRMDLVDAEGFSNDEQRLANRPAVHQAIDEWLMSLPDVAAAIEILEAHNVPCAPILSVGETLKHPHFLERGTVRTINDPLAGEIQIPGMPLKFSDYPDNPDYRAPLLGEHNAEILRTLLGKTDEEIRQLSDAGVLHHKNV